MSKERFKRRPVTAPPVHVKHGGFAPAAPMNDGELREANAGYFEYLAKFVGPTVAARALDLYIDTIKREAKEKKRDEAGVILGEYTLPE